MWHSGARVHISPTAVLLVAVFALMAPIVCLAAVLLAAVCHEMGHYIALRLCGGRLEGLSVSAFGAQMRIRDRNRLSYGREALCVLAGPLVNVTLSGLMSVGGKWREEFYLFAGAQLVLGVFNLLPLTALDGGRLVFLIVEAVRGKPVPPEKEGLVHVIGLIALLALFVVLTFHDIRTFILK